LKPVNRLSIIRTSFDVQNHCVESQKMNEAESEAEANDEPVPFVAVLEGLDYEKRRLVTVIGNDADAVWREALDQKNAGGIERAPHTRGLQQSEHTPGWWFVMLVERAAPHVCPMNPCTCFGAGK
jgi:hypothetical protein